MNHIDREYFDVCRYCHSCDYNINTTMKEYFETMLEDTFNIKMACFPRTTKASKLICENCILRLKDAFEFKNMVIANDKRFTKYFKNLKNLDGTKETVLNTNIEEDAIKSENILKSECDNSSNEVMDCMDYDSDCIKDEVRIPNDDYVESHEIKKRKLEETRNKPKRKRKRIILDDVEENKNNENWKKISERRGRGPILRENSLKLIANSTMFVFQWYKSSYTCFCCKRPFTDMKTLREHTDTEHSLKNIEKKIITQQNRLLKVEISSLNCRKCRTKLNTISDLRQHLSEIHNVKFDITDDLLVPFKIQTDGLKCQICSENFSMFRPLNIHVNKHYQNHVCHICGASFANLVFLNLHKTRLHKTFVCQECDVTFPNRTDKKNHDINEHNVKFVRKPRFPCQYCGERFFQENFKIQHLVEKHGMSKPEHKCSLCDKVFITKGLCNNHIKNVHMKEKKHECDICHNVFYTKSDVTRHRVTHTGEKKFTCSLCSSQFSTKDSLRRHMKRTHLLTIQH